MQKEQNPIQLTQSLITSVMAYLEHTPWRDLYCHRLEILRERADFPCELAIAGRVKAGKSSFLNALLGDDLALVGTTETTATINFFKYGRPRDAMHPVKVVWDDGSEEWQTRAFLDSLQGNSRDVLKRAQRIDHLEYYVDNPILQNITLVDTPGTGAVIEGDEHEKRTDEYLNVQKAALRKKHNDQSVMLKDRADAVVVMTEHVPTASTDELVSRFNDNTSAFNSLGVMTKIDTENETAAGWTRRCEEYARMLRQQLSTIIPVSAGVYRATMKLKQENKLAWMQRLLRMIPKEKDLFEKRVGNSTIFLSESPKVTEVFLKYGLSLSDRKSLVGDMPYRVFYTVAKELYYHSVDTAVANLVEYSGMENVRRMLEQQFFNRSRIIRCAKIVRDVHAILDEIRNHRFYEMRFDSNNREDYLKLVKGAYYSEDVKDALAKFIEKNICKKEQYVACEEQINKLIRDVEAVQQSFSGTDKKTEGIILLEKKQNSFRPNEIEELEVVLGKYPQKNIPKDTAYIARRWKFWHARKQQVSDSEVRKIIEMALYAYGTILN